MTHAEPLSIQRILLVVAAYLAPSRPLRYDQLAELLGVSVDDLGGILRDCKAYAGKDGYDCEDAGSLIRAELGLQALVPATFRNLLMALGNDAAEIADLVGEELWAIVAGAAAAETDVEAIDLLRGFDTAYNAWVVRHGSNTSRLANLLVPHFMAINDAFTIGRVRLGGTR